MGIFDTFKVFSGNNQNNVSAASLTSKKILIVEDEKSLGDALEIGLKNKGFIVVRAADGSVGLDLVAKEKPNLILLDLLMPVMNGNDMLARLRATPEYSGIPVIVLTNAGSVDNMKEIKSYNGVVDFLIKSNVSLEEIIDKINAYLHN